MKLDKTQFDGKRALIVGNKHPHKDKTAICIGASVASLLQKWGLVFKDDNDHEFFVFEPSDIKWL